MYRKKRGKDNLYNRNSINRIDKLNPFYFNKFKLFLLYVKWCGWWRDCCYLNLIFETQIMLLNTIRTFILSFILFSILSICFVWNYWIRRRKFMLTLYQPQIYSTYEYCVNTNWTEYEALNWKWLNIE